MAKAVVLNCPECGSKLFIQAKTIRTVSFDTEERSQVFAMVPTAEWRDPLDEESTECENINCGDQNCSSDHNYDKQMAKQLLNDDSVPKHFQYDWDYMEEDGEQIERITTVICSAYNCPYSKTISEVVVQTMENA